MLTMRKACVAAAAAQGGGEAVFSSCEIDRLRSMVFALTGCNADIRVDVEEGEGLSVLGDARQVRIVAESKPALARGFFGWRRSWQAGRRCCPSASGSGLTPAAASWTFRATP